VGTPQADPGCAVVIRYIAQVSRAARSGKCSRRWCRICLANDPNSKVVALNLVQA
jgi:hypothetical protein